MKVIRILAGLLYVICQCLYIINQWICPQNNFNLFINVQQNRYQNESRMLIPCCNKSILVAAKMMRKLVWAFNNNNKLIWEGGDPPLGQVTRASHDRSQMPITRSHIASHCSHAAGPALPFAKLARVDRSRNYARSLCATLLRLRSESHRCPRNLAATRTLRSRCRNCPLYSNG